VRRRKSITAGGGGGRRDAESANPTLTPEQQANAAMSDFDADFGPPKTVRLQSVLLSTLFRPFGRNVREFSMSFASRIEFEFLKPCFFSFLQ